MLVTEFMGIRFCKGFMFKIYGILILLFFIYTVQIVFSDDNKPLEKHIIIENNYDIMLINIIVKDYCIRWFDNFSLDLLNEFNKNNILYSEIK